MFTPAQRAAFAFARKLSYEPHTLADSDIDELHKHFSDLQILEMILSIAGNNSINRWKEGAGIPQSRESSNFLRNAEKPVPTDRPLPIKTYLTPTPVEFRDKISKVAPLVAAEKVGVACCLAISRRPPLEHRAAVEAALQACRLRTPRLPLAEDTATRALLASNWPDQPLPQWVRLLANFPQEGKSRIANMRSVEEAGDLSPLLKGQVSWIIARQDRAWYATGEAQRRLRNLGWSDEQVFKLDGNWSEFTSAERALFTLARQLAAAPIVLTDAEVAEAVKWAGPRQVVQLINYTASRALFDRLTEAAGLRLEEGADR